jgi:hypothetical protein
MLPPGTVQLLSAHANASLVAVVAQIRSAILSSMITRGIANLPLQELNI